MREEQYQLHVHSSGTDSMSLRPCERSYSSNFWRRKLSFVRSFFLNDLERLIGPVRKDWRKVWLRCNEWTLRPVSSTCASLARFPSATLRLLLLRLNIFGLRILPLDVRPFDDVEGEGEDGAPTEEEESP